jgi:hypothetical protein
LRVRREEWASARQVTTRHRLVFVQFREAKHRFTVRSVGVTRWFIESATDH